MEKIRIAVTPGDPDGIGPEIISGILKSSYADRSPEITIIGSKESLARYHFPFDRVEMIEAPNKSENFVPGFQAGWAIEKAVQMIQEKKLDALVTGPIDKDRLQKGGFPFRGHTDFLSHLTDRPDVTMMLENSFLRVSLVTTHIPLQEVASRISPDLIETTFKNTLEYLDHYCGIARPKIALAALNPHAGENGLLGNEEKEILRPCIDRLQKKYKNCVLFGPLPSDTLFALHHLKLKDKHYDAVICLYHDQGLIPVKLLDFHHTVNITLGLPFVRTSVDHGVGFDIAGKGLADPSSFLTALRAAERLAEKKKRNEDRK